MVSTDIISSIRQKLATELGEHLLEFHHGPTHRVYAAIAPAVVAQANRLLLDMPGARFQIATGVDTRAGIEVMYHWALDSDGLVVTLRTTVDHAQPELESIARFCVAAEWIEREMWELLGINFRGHPDLRHLLLDDDWPEGNFPLRHSADRGDTEVTP